MIKKAQIALIFVPAVLFGLLLFVSQTEAVSGGALSGQALAPHGVPMFQGALEVEPNDTITQANPINVNLTVLGQVPFAIPPVDIDFYRLTMPAAEVGRKYRVSLDESPTSGDYQLRLSLYDLEGDFIDSDTSTGGDAFLDWTSIVDTYYFSVEGVEVDADAFYEITVIRFDATPTPSPAPPWDDCEINDDPNGVWSPDTPPGGPCLLSVGLEHTDLNFVPYTGQPAPNDDYFVFLAKAGRTYRITTDVSGGADTIMTLYDPSGNALVTDDDGGEGAGSRIERTLTDGWYKLLVQDRLGNTSPTTSQTYDILIEDITPATSTPTTTPGPGTVTATPAPPVVPGEPDALEPNYWFDRASLIGLGAKYTNLNFVPMSSTEVDTDFYKLWVVAGKLYTCETSDLGTATNTNLIFCSGPSWEQCFAGNNDVEPFDPNDPYRSRLRFFSSYDGYLYIVAGQVGAERILPEEWENLSYSLQCYIDQPGTATPTPTSEYVPSTSTPVPATAVPSPTAAQIVVRPMTTPVPPPTSVPVATSEPDIYVVEILLYYDRNQNGSADAGEGIPDVLARTYDAIDGTLLSVDYTDETGFLRFSVPARGPIWVSVPFFSFDQVVTAADTNIQIRIAPLP